MSEPSGKEGKAPVGSAADAVFRIGAGVAKFAARAMTGKEQPRRKDETPIQEMFRHSATVAGTLVAFTIDAARDTGLTIAQGTVSNADNRAPSAPPSSRQEPAQETPVLQLERAGKLRIPFSVDNRSAEPMTRIEARLIEVFDEAEEPSKGLNVSLSPKTLHVAPHDFEKLTVEITARKNAKNGHYTVRFSIGEDPIELSIMLL